MTRRIDWRRAFFRKKPQERHDAPKPLFDIQKRPVVRQKSKAELREMLSEAIKNTPR